MSGLVFRRNGSNISLTESQYTNPSTGTMRLCIRDSNGNIVRYGLTSNSTASQYSPTLYINGTKCWIGMNSYKISYKTGYYVTVSITSKETSYTINSLKEARRSTFSSGLNTSYTTISTTNKTAPYNTNYPPTNKYDNVESSDNGRYVEGTLYSTAVGSNSRCTNGNRYYTRDWKTYYTNSNRYMTSRVFGSYSLYANMSITGASGSRHFTSGSSLSADYVNAYYVGGYFYSSEVYDFDNNINL